LEGQAANAAVTSVTEGYSSSSYYGSRKQLNAGNHITVREREGTMMMKHAFTRALILFVVSGFVFASSTQAADLSLSFMGGLKGGLGFRGGLLAKGFAKGFPFGVEISAGYAQQDPGNAAGARRIFINDATNGTPEQSGRVWDLRMDILYDLDVLREADVHAYGGVRYSMFTGNFVYVGGNEDFDVLTNQWGIGAGVRSQFSMSQRLGLVLSAGLDYYFDAGMKGHDTTYEPDGDDVNPRQGYTFKDADAAINQPKLQPVVMIGINYAL